jgi:uncharacterized iron-regulated membrane protein
MTQHLRVFILKLHLWLGLGVGALFALLGMTGSALVFYEALDAALHPEIRVESTAPAPGWDSPLWDRALQTVKARWPERSGAWRFEATGEPGAIAARHVPTHAGHAVPFTMVWLSPDGSQVLREADWGSTLMTWLYDLHMSLLLGDTGIAIVGWSGLVMTLLLLTGLWAWWPRGKSAKWSKALHFKRGAVRSRRLRDIHKLTGLAGLPLLLMLAVTGVMLALPNESNAVLAGTLGAPTKPPKLQASATSGPRISLAAALKTARAAFPTARLAWVESPGPGSGVIRVRVQQPSDPSDRFPHSYAYIDPITGALLGTRDRERFGAGDIVNNWLHPLHDGSVGGLGLRVLLVLAGLLPTVLFVTGLWRWRVRAIARRHGPHPRPAAP